MGQESETMSGERGRRAAAMAWFSDQLVKLWGNKAALLLAAYLVGNGSGTVISKVMAAWDGKQQPTASDSTEIFVREMRPIVMELQPVPQMVRELYIAVQKMKGGAKAMQDAQFEEFLRKQKEDRKRMDLLKPSASPPITSIVEPEPPLYTSRQSERGAP